MISKDLYIYDIEIYPNCFTIAIADYQKRLIHCFEISFRKDERKKLFKYLNHIYKTNGVMVGFNNISFDYPVIHFLTENKSSSANRLYRKAQAIIDAQYGGDKWKHSVREKDMFLPQIDLFKVHHFDNKARMTSLKMIEFNMRSDNITDLPYKVGTDLTSEQIDNLIKYNKHDVLETLKFLDKSMTKLEFREELSKKYKRNFMNHNDTKIGKDYFVMELEKAIPECCYKNRKMQQTKRDKIDLSECIVPYVKFERPEFKAVKEWFEQQVISETKGVFTDLPENVLGNVAKYANMRTKRQRLTGKPSDKTVDKWRTKYPACFFTEEKLATGKISHFVNWNIAECLNVVVDGLQYDFGVGGLHGAKHNSVLSSNDELVVKSYDVASYYPNLSIKNRLYPEHLSEQFCDIYEDVYEQRKILKKQGKETEQLIMKLALNGTYGASNDQYSPFLDPKFTMSITISGQLSLCMLAEELLKIKDLEIVMVNTDGLEFVVPREFEQKADDICKEWEVKTQLELEAETYERLMIRDVNNYVGVFDNGKIKRKGAYEYEGLDWNKNHSNLIVKKAACNYLLNDVPVDVTIKEYDDLYDFMLRTKVPRSSKLMLVDDFLVDHEQQNICRYYACNASGDDIGELVKVMPPTQEYRDVRVYKDQHGTKYKAYTKADITKYEKIPKTSRGRSYELIDEYEEKCEDRRIGIEAGQKVKICNDIKNFTWEDVDYDYYIKEAEKLIQFSIASDDDTCDNGSNQ